MKTDRIIPYQFLLPSENYLDNAPKGVFFYDKIEPIDFCPIPKPRYGLDIDDFSSDRDFGLWFKQLAFRFGEYCQNDNLPEPSVHISSDGKQLYVQSRPVFGTKDHPYFELVNPPPDHEFVLNIHGHCRDRNKYMQYFSTGDLGSISQSISDIKIQIDALGFTAAWRTSEFFVKLSKFQMKKHLYSKNYIGRLGRDFYQSVLDSHSWIEKANDSEVGIRRYINVSLANALGLKIARFAFDYPNYRMLGPVIMNDPEPVSRETERAVNDYKKKIIQSTRIPGLI